MIVRAASINYHTRDWDKRIKDGTVAQYVIRIPELANAELKLTVDVERVTLDDRGLPGFAELRPARVVIQLGGDEVYAWMRPEAQEQPVEERVQVVTASSLPMTGGAAPVKRR